MMRHALRLLALALAVGALAGCSVCYQADNGPRGPERLSLGPPWACPQACPGAAPGR